jgi:putative ABC transport system permease protein
VSFVGEGVEPRQEATLSKALGFSAGRGLAAADVPEALLGEGLAKSLGAGVGDTVTLLVNTPGGGFNGVELRVAGVFYSASKAYDDRALRLPLPVAQRLTRSEGLSRLIAVLPRTDDVPAAARQLGAALAKRPVVVRQWHELADFYTKSVDLFRRQLAAVRVVIVAVVLLWISNAMARNVMDRTREIGTMMALGRTRASVARTFLGEGLAIGVVGALLGVAAGAALAGAISAVGIPMPPPPGMAHGFIGGVEFTAGIAALAAGCAALSAVLASVAPAWRAARLPIVDALRSAR